MAFKALVTGGAGFIGSHLVDWLVEKGWQVIVLDDLSQSTGENLAQYDGDSRVAFIRGTILDESLVRTAMSGCTHVFHLAAVIGVRYVVDDPLHGMLTNVRGTEIILEAAQKIGARVVVASSSEIYGRGIHAPLSEDDDSLIGPTSVPRWSYALSKGLDEHLAFAYYRQHGMQASVVRYFNIYGPRCLPAGYGVIARFIQQSLDGRALTVHGDGIQSRCFTFIEDAVMATFLAGTIQGAVGQAFNVGIAQETTIGDLAEIVRSSMQGTNPIEHISHAVDYGTNFQDTRRRVPDVTKARNILGFTARTGLSQGVRTTVDWWLQRQEQRKHDSA